MHTAELSWSRVLDGLSGALASVIFPSDCRICESLLQTASRLPVCNDCLASFRRNPLEICDICGVPWGVPGESDEEFAICPEFRQQKYGFERARSYGQYEGALARAIVLLKYEHIEPLGKWFADRLLEVVRADEKRLWADMVVPVPCTSRERKNAGTTKWSYLRSRWQSAWGSHTGRYY